jgi:hypothetical protein
MGNRSVPIPALTSCPMISGPRVNIEFYRDAQDAVFKALGGVIRVARLLLKFTSSSLWTPSAPSHQRRSASSFAGICGIGTSDWLTGGRNTPTIHTDRTVECEAAAMRTLISISALCLVSSLTAGAAFAQPYAPNGAGVTMGHWHLNSRDVQAKQEDFCRHGRRSQHRWSA